MHSVHSYLEFHVLTFSVMPSIIHLIRKVGKGGSPHNIGY